MDERKNIGRFVWLQTIDPEMVNKCEFVMRRFGGGDIDLRIYGEGINGEDNGIVRKGQRQCKITFSRSGRTDDCQLFHKSYYTLKGTRTSLAVLTKRNYGKIEIINEKIEKESRATPCKTTPRF